MLHCRFFEMIDFPTGFSWADEHADDHADELLYSLVDKPTRGVFLDFSTIVNVVCSAIETAHLDLKKDLVAIVDEMKQHNSTAITPYENEKHFKLSCFYNNTQRRFIMLIRGTLLMFQLTGIRSGKDDKSALVRMSNLCEMSETPKRFKTLLQAISSSNNEEKRKTADIAKRKSKLAEAKFFRRIICILYGIQPNVDDEQDMWKDAWNWALKFVPNKPVMDRMHDCLSAILKHKRSIDMEKDSTWIYVNPKNKCLPFVGGIHGTLSE